MCSFSFRKGGSSEPNELPLNPHLNPPLPSKVTPPPPPPQGNPLMLAKESRAWLKSMLVSSLGHSYIYSNWCSPVIQWLTGPPPGHGHPPPWSTICPAHPCSAACEDFQFYCPTRGYCRHLHPQNHHFQRLLCVLSLWSRIAINKVCHGSQAGWDTLLACMP